MGYTGQIPGHQRAASGIAAAGAVIAVGWVMATGFDLTIVRKAQDAISAIAIPAPAPSKPPVPAEARNDTASGEASAANRRAKAAAVAAPQTRLPPIIPPPVSAAPRPGTGNEASAGATPEPGPGSGAGGQGDGTGSGGSGRGMGGGTRPAWLSGRIADRDYPGSASRARVGGEVEVRFTIEASGRVTRCRVSRSSGDAALDSTTCRLIEDRFRFRPATNARGEAIASEYGWRQSWWLERR